MFTLEYSFDVVKEAYTIDIKTSMFRCCNLFVLWLASKVGGKMTSEKTARQNDKNGLNCDFNQIFYKYLVNF